MWVPIRALIIIRVSLSLGQGVGSDKGSNHNKGVFKFRP